MKAKPPPYGTIVHCELYSDDPPARSVVAAGGKILVPAYEIPERGRFCVFQAPGGTVHNLVEALPGMEWWE